MYHYQKNKVIFLLLLWVTEQQASAQTQYPSVEGTYIKAPQSPNAASLSTYGDIPVDLFTGTPSISIPVQTVQYEGMSVPISLSYHASGIRAGEQPGWGGLGWDVIAGGQITRKVKWFVDEYYNRKAGIGTKPDKGYYFLGKSLDRPDWNTTAVMEGKIDFEDVDSLGDNEPDEFVFSFGGYSGSFYRSEKGEWKVKSKQNIQLEITNEINYSGGFKLYLLNPENNLYDQPGASENVQSLFKKFTITTPDGFRYIFGGDTSSIEFSRSGISDQDPNFEGTMTERSSKITANTWYLAKIITPSNDSIIFNYKKGFPVFSQNFSRSGIKNTLGECVSTTSHYFASVIVPSYLTSIETPVSRVEFVASKAGGPRDNIDPQLLPGSVYHDEAQYMVRSVTLNWGDLSRYWTYADNNSDSLPNYNRQLDTIRFFDKINGIYTRGVKLFQGGSATVKRTLDSLMFFDYANSSNNQKYTFAYSNVSLLPSNSSATYQKDHWGFYNGYNADSDGWPVKSPNEKSLYGLISKITYPTGGETQFEFEQADYMYSVKIDPSPGVTVPVDLYHEEGKAGNRIKKITHIPYYGGLPIARQYYYQTNYAGGGTASSGILLAQPKYKDKVVFHFNSGLCAGDHTLINQSDDNSEWLGQVNGGIVTYSEVAEKSADGSYVVHKFTNNDNPVYRDELHDNLATSSISLGYVVSNDNYRLTSNDLERGQPLTESYYNNSGTLVKQLSYTYRNDPARKNEYVKAYAHRSLLACTNSCNDAYGAAGGPRLWAYRIYTYKNPLKTLTETEYNGSTTFTKTTNYTYDVYGNTTATIILTSDGRRVEEDTRYNSHPDFLGTASDADAIGVNKLFTQYKIKNYPVEKLILTGPGLGSTQTGADNMLKGTLYHYDPLYPLVSKVQMLELTEPFAPLTYDASLNPVYHFTFAKISGGAFTYDSRYKPQMQALGYTLFGSTTHKYTALEQNARMEAYTWDYLTQYTASVTRNVTGTDPAFNSFEGIYKPSGVDDDNKGNWVFNKDNIVAGGFTGNKCLNVSSGTSALTSRYALDYGRSYTLSFWAKGSTPQILVNGSGLPQSYTVLKQSGDWSYYNIQLVGTAQTIGIKGNGFPGTLWVDEVRLYMSGASMKSYTYDAATGNPTTITDETGTTSFYTYDGFGRLLYIKDEQGNILKKYTYQLQGAE